VPDRDHEVGLPARDLRRQRAQALAEVEHQCRAGVAGTHGDAVEVEQRAVVPVRLRQREYADRRIRLKRGEHGIGPVIAPFLTHRDDARAHVGAALLPRQQVGRELALQHQHRVAR